MTRDEIATVLKPFAEHAKLFSKEFPKCGDNTVAAGFLETPGIVSSPIMFRDFKAALRVYEELTASPAPRVDNGIVEELAQRIVELLPQSGIKFPPHNCELTLTHNPHKNTYQTTEEWVRDIETTSPDYLEWVSVEDRQSAIATDEIWTLQWYPDTPFAFRCVAGSTMEAVLSFVQEDE
jgi:hypothetical protein